MSEVRSDRRAAARGIDAKREMSNCRICQSDMPIGARYCTTCDKYQSIPARLFSGLGIASITTLLPVAALVFAFVQDRLGTVGSDVRAVLLGCTDANVQAGLSNVGNRPAIVRGGFARMHASGMPQITRELQPAGGVPFALDPQRTQLSQFRFILADDRQATAMPPRPDPGRCFYELSLSIVDFDGRQAEHRLQTCTCPA